MSPRKKILLKITGEIFLTKDKTIDPGIIIDIANQIKTLEKDYHFALVIGGGNFFRGDKQGKALGLTPYVGHQIGMFATLMNGLMLRDIFEKQGLKSTILSAVDCPEAGLPIYQQTIENALGKGGCVIFTGGTGNPFFTTDTNAVLRALQIGSKEVWKASNVSGVYDSNPNENPDAKLIKRITAQEALNRRLNVLDITALALAEKHELKIRVFNIFKNDAILTASQDETFGSVVTQN